MLIGTRLRVLREGKGLSQGDIEKSSGLLRCYVSRIENGHTLPSLETLERLAGALGMPIYQFFLGEGEPSPDLDRGKGSDELGGQPAQEGAETRLLLQFRNLLAQLGDPDRDVLLTLAKRLAAR
jgi:transcriptional regulator with XRE-family HTH domain